MPGSRPPLKDSYSVVFHRGGKSVQILSSRKDDAKQMNAWDEIKQNLAKNKRRGLSELGGANLVQRAAERLPDRVAVPNEFTRDWMQTEYAGLVRAIIRDETLPVSAVSMRRAAVETAGYEPHLCIRDPARLEQPPAEPQVHFRQLRRRLLQPVRPCGGESGGHQPVAQLQPAVHLWRRGHGQDAPDARHRPRR